MKEKNLLDFFKKVFSYPKKDGLLIGPGDDCAVADIKNGKYVLLTTDEVQEGTHFLTNFTKPELLASKLVRMNVSDIYSMGKAKPLFCVVAGGIGKNISEKWIKRFSVSLRKEAALFGMKIAGGNLCKADKTHFSMTVLGTAEKKRLMLRKGAKEGDLIMGAGSLGEAKAGLEILISGGPKNKIERKLVDSFWKPKICVKESDKISKYASCMLDNSDGLFKSLEILSLENSLKAECEIPIFSVSNNLIKWCEIENKNWKKYALEGGEDYGLIFCAAAKFLKKIKKEIPQCYVLGKMKKGKGVLIKNYEAEIRAFEHF
ncbi:MAG: thiamine-phosphate kinase [Elusimicrobia bacterium]|nr:thiamine-phosphate kinase [Elusimicrobiota bacterium]